ncbi:MAG: hypothetical protein IJB97_04075, partial [Clostridia bacterium]|nr:hypothetical protein [Clostridia bacterium]
MAMTKSRKWRKALRAMLPVVDAVFVFASAIFAYWLYSSQLAVPTPVLIWGVIASAVALVLFQIFGMYSMVLSSINIFDCMRLLASLAIFGICNLLFAVLVGASKFGIGVSMAIIQTILIFCFSGSIRFSKRFLLAVKRMNAKNKKDDGKTRVMIVGGGDSGTMLVKEMIT